MADREDIDALLVGALYGELDEADRARLDAHLASHPQDRMALEAMRSTRGLVRDAEVAAAMVEPPAGVSALLLQEAARRAPQARTAGAGGGILGFLAGLIRPMVAHPALAAAATLVVVAGVAGALYVGGTRPVHPDRTMSAASESAPAGATAGTADLTPTEINGALAGVPAPLAEGQAGLAASAVAAGTGTAAVAEPALPSVDGADYDSYRVSLDDKAKAAATRETRKNELGFAGEAKPAAAKGERAEATADASKDGSRVAADRAGYIEVPAGRQQLPLRNLEGDALVAREAPSQPTRTATTGARADTTGTGADWQASAPADGAGLSTTSPVPGSSFAQPPAAGVAAATPDATLARPYNARTDAATLAWARDQHARMVKLATAGKCNEAGQVGLAIVKRAPDYYQAEVYNDRRVRNCRAYVDKARRAAEPSRRRDLPSPAAADEAPVTEKLN